MLPYEMKYYNRKKPKDDEQSQEASPLETVVSGTKWISGEIGTPCDGDYLCVIYQKQECGTIWKYQRVVKNSINKWVLDEGETVVCWSKLPEIPKEYH